MRGLIVDDAVFMRKILRDIFVDHGYEIIAEAGDGHEAVQAYREHQPDFVTMDVVMPRMNGIEAVKAICGEDGTAAIVMVSAIGQESMIAQALDIGARDYVVKPFRKEDVLAAVAGALVRP